ncbi:hypothetical protein GOP47_0020535 [Adiantum capillus-veneris]|uniref:Uncharacterized protein n=1 Tax=Adiantum capillus-veneris TaxID=13818 RepID=A0A9D4Z7J2_ADICA|nr:hypothetical protein GOP47_0020535 [Adiantum capillus-veneris]
MDRDSAAKSKSTNMPLLDSKTRACNRSSMSRHGACGPIGKVGMIGSRNIPIDLCTPPAFESHDQPINLCTSTPDKSCIVHEEPGMRISMLINDKKFVVPKAKEDATRKDTTSSDILEISHQRPHKHNVVDPNTLRRSTRLKAQKSNDNDAPSIPRRSEQLRVKGNKGIASYCIPFLF